MQCVNYAGNAQLKKFTFLCSSSFFLKNELRKIHRSNDEPFNFYPRMSVFPLKSSCSSIVYFKDHQLIKNNLKILYSYCTLSKNISI